MLLVKPKEVPTRATGDDRQPRLYDNAAPRSYPESRAGFAGCARNMGLHI